MDQGAFRIGLQVGHYGDQIAGNTTTAVPGRVYVKDNLGYGALGGLSDALHEVSGIEINAWCDFLGRPPIALGLGFSRSPPDDPQNRWDGHIYRFHLVGRTTRRNSELCQFDVHAVQSSAVSFKWTSMYAVVNASGNGALFIADNSGLSTACTWDTIPHLVYVQLINYVAVAYHLDDARVAPAYAGRAVFETVRGMAEAVRLGAMLYAPSKGYPSPAEAGVYPGPATIMEVLLADGVKSALTQYTAWCVWYPARCCAAGVATCNSHDRTVQAHWRFGNEHNLGIPVVALNLVFGFYALWVVWRVAGRPRVKGVEPFKVVDGFKMGLGTTTAKDEGNGDEFWALQNGSVGARGESWTVVEEPESVPLDPTGANPQAPRTWVV
ncbi:hypothetical protein FB451DRAFT_1557080 [Mycena latifolia]|nr:hypothetical protein FB451DRAFT_1557080 [Mycena latifolia]